MGLPRLHVVTDDVVLASSDFMTKARRVLQVGGGEVALHLRGPGSSVRELVSIGVKLAAEMGRTGGILLVNDRIDVALACASGGVQLASHSMALPDARAVVSGTGRGPVRGVVMGTSVHGVEEGVSAAQAGTDFLIFGTVYQTASHPGRLPAGVEVLAELRHALDGIGMKTPVIGIGGITPERTREVVESGAWGVAVISGIWGVADPGEAVARYLSGLSASPAIG